MRYPDVPFPQQNQSRTDGPVRATSGMNELDPPTHAMPATHSTHQPPTHPLFGLIWNLRIWRALQLYIRLNSIFSTSED